MLAYNHFIEFNMLLAYKYCVKLSNNHLKNRAQVERLWSIQSSVHVLMTILLRKTIFAYGKTQFLLSSLYMDNFYAC